MENNKNNKKGKNAQEAQQGEQKSLLNAEPVLSGFGKKLPKDCESMEYVNKIGSAMRAWRKSGDSDKRGYLLLAVGENGEDNPDARSLVYSAGGSNDNLINMVMHILDSSSDFRRIMGIAIEQWTALAAEKQQSNNYNKAAPTTE